MIAKDLVEFIAAKQPFSCRVQTIFEKSLNVVTPDDEMITIASEKLEIMPMGLILEKGYLSRPIEQSDLVIFQESQLLFPHFSQSINFTSAKIWDPKIKVDGLSILPGRMNLLKEQVSGALVFNRTQGLAQLFEIIFEKAAAGAEIAIDLYCQHIKDALLSFIQALNDLNWKEAAERSKQLIGFGQGLTPSCDDFLSAITAVLYYLAEIDPEKFGQSIEFNEKIVLFSQGKTTFVSQQMLKHAARGKLGNAQKSLLEALFTDNSDDIKKEIDTILKIGATSGIDFLFGFYCILELLTKNQ